MKLVSRLYLLTLVAFTVLLAACGGTGGSVQQPPPPSGDPCGGQPCINQVNHVIMMLQENRSFDDYFGRMTAYRQANNIPINSADGKINDLSTGSYSNNNFQTGQTIASYHTGSICTEDLTPDWGPTHIMMNHANPAQAGPGSPMDGFVGLAFAISQAFGPTFITDQTGKRAMGFFDSNDVNYYYFMASNFAMSDALYSPAPARTAPNRLYIHGATSQGFAKEPGAPCGGAGELPCQLTSKTIWQLLDQKGVSWKIYVTDPCGSAASCSTPTFLTYASFFSYWNDPAVQKHAAPVDDNAKKEVGSKDWQSRSSYMDDVKNGTLPSVSFIETGMFTGRDEHPSNINKALPPGADQGMTSVQAGAQFVSGIMNALMQSPSWKDSVFFFAFDEGGGLFDHVPPISVPSPDNVKPIDLAPGDVPGDFTITGFRVPNFVVSPFAKKNFVSHMPIDFTAWLKFIETRWGLPNLNARDAAMPDISDEFFDFKGTPWATPPSPPKQNTNGACDFTKE